MSERNNHPEASPNIARDELLARYEVIDDLSENLTFDAKGFLRDDENNYLVYRRQRSVDTPFNTKPGRKVKAGLYGHTLGFANTEAALRGASGHIDSPAFLYNVLYKLPSEFDVVDLRKRMRKQHLGLRAAATTVELMGGIPPVTNRIFEKALQEHDGLIVNRPLSQKVMSPYAYQAIESNAGKFNVPPAWMIVHPSEQLTLVAYRNRKEEY